MAECTFVDGPAAGHKLGLRRYPAFLRLVVNTENGGIDALDQLDDTPQVGEDVYVYRRIDYGHARGFGWFATYLHVTLTGAQPTQVRDTPRWRALVDDLAEEHPDWVRSAGQPEQEERMADEEKQEGQASGEGVDKLQDAEVDPGRVPDDELADEQKAEQEDDEPEAE